MKEKIDWDVFRAETARAIIAAEAGGSYTSMDSKYAEVRCRTAIAWADELIKQLKEEH